MVGGNLVLLSKGASKPLAMKKKSNVMTNKTLSKRVRFLTKQNYIAVHGYDCRLNQAVTTAGLRDIIHDDVSTPWPRDMYYDWLKITMNVDYQGSQYTTNTRLIVFLWDQTTNNTNLPAVSDIIDSTNALPVFAPIQKGCEIRPFTNRFPSITDATRISILYDRVLGTDQYDNNNTITKVLNLHGVRCKQRNQADSSSPYDRVLCFLLVSDQVSSEPIVNLTMQVFGRQNDAISENQ